MKPRHFWISATVAILLAAPAVLHAQTRAGTAFTYQGRLKLAGAGVDDTVDFEFTLWDAQTGGSSVGDPNGVSVTSVNVVKGLFTVVLDFGNVFTGEARWLEIAVRSPAGSGQFTTLSPRQELTPVPYAQQIPGIFVADDGNVGIGTTSPDAKLEVSGSNNESIRANNASLSGRWIEMLYSTSWGPLLRGGNGYERLTLDANSGSGAGKIVLGRGGDKVGVGGQLDPAYELDVTGDIRATGTIYGAVNNADKVDAYHAGNASGQVAVSNGTKCATLNADKVDGNHVALANVFTVGGTQYVVNTAYVRIYAYGTINSLRIETPTGADTIRYYYSKDFATPTLGHLSSGQSVNITGLANSTIDIRIYGDGHVTFFGVGGGNGWIKGHVIYE